MTKQFSQAFWITTTITTTNSNRDNHQDLKKKKQNFFESNKIRRTKMNFKSRERDEETGFDLVRYRLDKISNFRISHLSNLIFEYLPRKDKTALKGYQLKTLDKRCVR